MEFLLDVLDRQSKVHIYMDHDLEKVMSQTTDLCFIFEGQIECAYKKMKKEQYVENQLIILNKYDDYTIKTISEYAVYMIIECSDSLFNQAVNTTNLMFDTSNLYTQSLENEAIQGMFHKLFELIILKEYRANFLIYSTFYELLHTIVVNYSFYSNFSQEKVDKKLAITKFLFSNYMENITLTEIASEFYMEPSYFSKYFKKQFGINYKDYLMDLRISFAEKALIFTSANMVKIANDNGFSNISSFNRAFKMKHQMSPSTYRKKYRHPETSGIPESGNSQSEIIRLAKRLEAIQSKYHTLTTDSSQINIASNQSGEPIVPIWNHILNIGHANDLLSNGVRKHIRFLHEQLSFKYARIWSVFLDNDSIDWKHEQILNYEHYDEIFDSILDLHLIPWIVINKTSNEEYHLENINLDIYKHWKVIFEQFMKHMLDRYGIEKVKYWKFEVVMENVDKRADQIRYTDLFKQTYQVVKMISPQIEIGGASFKGNLPSMDILKLNHEIPLEKFDFYSISLFPYIKQTTRDTREFARIIDSDYMQNALTKIIDQFSQLASKPLFITEWNMTVSNHNLMNDTLYKGAYILKNVLDIIGKVDGIGYAGATDFNLLNLIDTEFLTGGSGLLNKKGIPKISFKAFQFLNELQNTKLIEHEPGYAICENENENEWHILFYNYQHPNQLYFMKKEYNLTPVDIQKFFSEDKIHKQFNLTGLENGIYEVRTFLCDQNNGDLFTLWKSFNYTNNLRQSDYAYMKQKNFPYMSLETIVVKEHNLGIRRELTTNAFCMINILKRQK